MSYALAISITLAIIAFLFINISKTFSEDDDPKNKPLSHLFFHLGLLMIYALIFSLKFIAADAGMTSLENILETIGIVWMWIWILLFIYFVIRLLFYVADWRKRTKDIGEEYDSSIK